MSDHMLILEWNKKTGWKDPQIKQYGDLLLDPKSSVFHYGAEVKFFVGHQVSTREPCFYQRITKNIGGEIRELPHICNIGEISTLNMEDIVSR